MICANWLRKISALAVMLDRPAARREKRVAITMSSSIAHVI
jgi:hypothetical protein